MYSVWNIKFPNKIGTEASFFLYHILILHRKPQVTGQFRYQIKKHLQKSVFAHEEPPSLCCDLVQCIFLMVKWFEMKSTEAGREMENVSVFCYLSCSCQQEMST